MTDVPRRLPLTRDERVAAAAGQTHAALSGRGSVLAARPVVVGGAVIPQPSTNPSSSTGPVIASANFLNTSGAYGATYGLIPLADVQDEIGTISDYIAINSDGTLSMLVEGWYQFAGYSQVTGTGPGARAGLTMNVLNGGFSRMDAYTDAPCDASGVTSLYCATLPLWNYAAGNIAQLIADSFAAGSAASGHVYVVKLAD